VVLLVDAEQRAKIIHNGRKLCTRVTRSVMAAVLLGLVEGYENGLLIAEIVSGLLSKKRLVGCWDTRWISRRSSTETVFDTVTRLSKTMEKRLQIDAFALQEAHQRGELTALYWITSADNVADPMTKMPWQEQSALGTLMGQSRLQSITY
jgi:hypothetical protein